MRKLNKVPFPASGYYLSIYLGSVMVLTMACREAEMVPLKQTTPVVIEKPPAQFPKELMSFADLPEDALNDIKYKEIPSESSIVPGNLETSLKLYNCIVNGNTTNTMPLFEIGTRGERLVICSAKGYMGNIWAFILVDSASNTIKKIQFDHKWESEGFGSGITNNSFKTQFESSSDQGDMVSYGLQHGENKVLEGSYMIDGVSGATVTSLAAVKMVNEVLSRLR